MAETSKLNKPLWTNITRLKLLTKPNPPVKFILEKSPFDDDDDEKEAIEQDRYVVIGRIFPNSDIYKDYAIKIEIILTSKYPEEAPEVRFLTPVYHPNIENDGESILVQRSETHKKRFFLMYLGTFCHQLVSNSSRWKKGTTLVEVVQAVVKHLDEPDPLYAANFGKDY
jgi:ubiquitin-protein ligase